MSALDLIVCRLVGHDEAYPPDCPYWSQRRGTPTANYCRRCGRSRPDHRRSAEGAHINEEQT